MSVESVDFVSQSDSHTSSDALISEASEDPEVFPEHWLDYPDVNFPHPDKPTINRDAAISPVPTPSASYTSNGVSALEAYQRMGNGPADHTADPPPHPKPSTALRPAKRLLTEYNPPPRLVTVGIKNIAWTDDVTAEVRATISEVMGPAADGVTTLPSFCAIRGGEGNDAPFVYFTAPSIDWARWFCATWNRTVASTVWEKSSAYYEIL